jgi:hypothetical protein
MSYPHLPAVVERAINSLSVSPSTRNNVRDFLTGDPEIHRAITKHVFGIMNSKEAWAGNMALSAANPALAPLVQVVQGGSKGIQYLIRWLAQEEQKHGRLTPEVRRKVLDTLNLRRL